MTFDSKYLAINRIPPFDCLQDSDLIEMAAEHSITIRSYEKGQIVHLQHEVCQHLDVILEGRIAVQNIDPNGNVLTIQVFAERDLLGVNLLFASRNRYPMMAIAERKSVVAHVSGQKILKLCQTNDHFMAAVLKVISDRTVLLTDKIQSIAFNSIRQSLLEFIRFESALQQNLTIRLPMSKKTLAEKLGIERTSLSRELNKMRRDGLIEFDVHTITLKS
jgi:CRP-like cAMP-binding protein